MTGEPDRPTIAVVVPTYNRRDRLPLVIEPLLAQPELNELVVVVDGCDDGSIELAESYAAADPRVVPHLIENRGLARARLAGAEKATAEVVLTTDDDVIAEPGLVGGHARRHCDRSHLVVVGYMPVAPRPPRVGEFPRELYAREYERATRAWEARPETILGSFWAGNFSLRRADYVALAPAIAEITPDYHEDRDFGLRCRELGLEAEFDRSLRASHQYERSREAFLHDARGSAKSLLTIERVHGGKGPALPKDFPLDGLNAPARPLVWAAGHSEAAMKLLLAGIDVCGRFGLRKLERFGGNLAWRAEQLRTVKSLG
jgi:glycosyltransferase involved in cell wall biosynthesis